MAFFADLQDSHDTTKERDVFARQITERWTLASLIGCSDISMVAAVSHEYSLHISYVCPNIYTWLQSRDSTYVHTLTYA